MPARLDTYHNPLFLFHGKFHDPQQLLNDLGKKIKQRIGHLPVEKEENESSDGGLIKKSK